MMATALSIVLGLCALFGAVIIVGLKVRGSSRAANRRLTARDVWTPAPGDSWRPTDMLYGVWLDFSAREIGLIVRDSNDQEVGTIRFRMGSRQDWITLQAGEECYSASVLPAARQVVVLRTQGGTQTLCTFRRLAGGLYRFEAEGMAALESRPDRGFSLRPRYTYVREGQPIGFSQHIGGWMDRGRLLVLPAGLPLPVRLFVLAMQARRA